MSVKAGAGGHCSLFFFKNFYVFIFRGEGREKERERNINVWLPLMCPLLGTWPATQACALTGNWASDPVVHRPALNPLSHTGQGHSFMFFTSLLFPLASHFYRCGPWTSSIQFSWEPVRNAGPQAPPQTYWFRIFILTRTSVNIKVWEVPFCIDYLPLLTRSFPEQLSLDLLETVQG